MADDPNRVWPSGLTTAEAEELQQGLVDGTRVFFMIAVIAVTNISQLETSPRRCLM